MIVVYYGVNLSLSLPFCLSSFSPSRFPSSPSLTVSQSCLAPPALALPLLFFFPPSSSSGFSILPGLAPPSPSPSPSLWAILLCSRCPARCKYSLFAPPLDMAKEAICALLAILGHFFEAFSPLDLFFALSPFRPVPRPFPDSVHLGFHRLVSPRSRTSPRLRLLVPALSSPRRSFQPSPAPVRPCQLRAVRTRPLSTHAGF